MRIASGTTDQVCYFVAVDSSNSRLTGLSSFTVYRARNGAAAVLMDTPTVTEVSAANMPGVYTLLMDEDMTIATGNDEEEMLFHISHAGMDTVDRAIELYRPKITGGNTLDVDSSGNIAEAVYHADIQFNRDEANTQDEYTVTWFKNAVRVASGITSPTIQVVKRVDGTDLVAATAMTQIGTTGSYKYDASGAERQTLGESSIVIVAATIDGGSRAFSRVLGRDSS